MTVIESPRIFHQTLAIRLALLLLFAFGIGILLSISFVGNDAEKAALSAAIVAAVAYVVIAFAIGRTYIITTPLAIRRETILGITDLPWPEITEYRYRLLGRQRSGDGPQPERFVLTLSTVDGRRITIGPNYRNAVAMRDVVFSRVHPRMIRTVRAELDNQHPVTFGPLTLRPDGIVYKEGRPLLFSEIATIDLASPRLCIKRTGKQNEAIAIGSDRIPNVVAFIELAQEAARKKGRDLLAPVSAGS